MFDIFRSTKCHPHSEAFEREQFVKKKTYLDKKITSKTKNDEIDDDSTAGQREHKDKCGGKVVRL